MSAPIARIAPGNSIQPEETPSSSHAEQSRTFLALARGRLARRGGIAIHAKMLHLPHTARDMDKKDKNADVHSALPSPLTGPRSAWGSSGASRGRPRRLLWPARSTRTSRSGRMARLGPCSAGGCRRLPFPPAPAKKSARAKIDTSTTFFFTPVIGSDNGGFTRYGCAVAKKCGRLFSTIRAPHGLLDGTVPTNRATRFFWVTGFFLRLLSRG